ncbi:MAG TPA: nuclease-related domain-containing protein [Opitutaceae bacterium]
MDTGTAILVGYMLLFLAFVAGTLVWRRHSRKERKPFPDHLKLLRGPGESQRQRLAQLEEATLNRFLLAFLVPVAVGLALLWITTRLTGAAQLIGLIVTGLGLLASMGAVARLLAARIEEWRNRYLGYFGERVVAEALDPLKTHGFRVFHDVPAGDAKAPFNIDHVVAGPSGVFAIETKTRRKGSTRAGFAEHEIIFDGEKLLYPWGEDRHGLDQAQRHARWLEQWLSQLLGQRVPVKPVLTFPGWTVVQQARGPIEVLAPRQIPALVAAPGESAAPLSRDQLDLVAHHLEDRCRDVEF